MRIGVVIGNVVLAQAHSSLRGARYAVAVPLMLNELSTNGYQSAPFGGEEELIVYDELGAGTGNLIAISEGGEAAQPFLPEMKPVDAYNAAILDDVHIVK